MKGYRSLILIACILLSISIAIYVIHYLIFHDLNHIFIYMVGHLAFLPLEVLIVGIVVERILSKRELEEKLPIPLFTLFEDTPLPTSSFSNNPITIVLPVTCEIRLQIRLIAPQCGH